MNRWEYCVISGIKQQGSGLSGQYPIMIYFGTNGIKQMVDLSNHGASRRPKGWEKVSEQEYISAFIAKLGQQGWEMVNAVITQYNELSEYPSHSIYFKRLIEE